MSRRNRKANQVPLIIETHPEEYNGYPFITLIEYRDKSYLTVVDNSTDKAISAYVLDSCNSEGVDEEMTITIISEWYEQSNMSYPVSIEFSKQGLSGHMTRIYRTYNLDYVTRVIGPLPRFDMDTIIDSRKKKKKQVPLGIRITMNKIVVNH